MLETLKQEVCKANLLLKEWGLVVLTWGNVSARDSDTGLVVIKPSGVPYDTMTPEQMVVCDIEGKTVEGDLRPSSDLPTHLELYRAFGTGAVAHTHSSWAVAWAQAGRALPAYGTTHADTFYGAVPCTRDMTREEIRGEYEKNTGLVIAETFSSLNPADIPAVLVKSHGPFTWGDTPLLAAEHALILEECCKMASRSERICISDPVPMDGELMDRHYLRKHGKNAYYGQN